MTDDKIITLLKVAMVFGILLIQIGIYLHMYEPHTEAMGITGILISPGFVVFGVKLS